LQKVLEAKKNKNNLMDLLLLLENKILLVELFNTEEVFGKQCKVREFQECLGNNVKERESI